MRLCVWDVSGGRSQVVDSLWTGSVGFCQGSVLQSSSASFLLALPGEQTEEVRLQLCVHSNVFQPLLQVDQCICKQMQRLKLLDLNFAVLQFWFFDL